MKKALAVMFALTISAAYAASSYHVNLYKPTVVHGTQFNAGDCKVELQGDRVVIKQGKTSAEVNVTVQNTAQKSVLTSVVYDDQAGNEIREVRLGGTTLKLVFDAGAKSEGAVAGK